MSIWTKALLASVAVPFALASYSASASEARLQSTTPPMAVLAQADEAEHDELDREETEAEDARENSERRGLRQRMRDRDRGSEAAGSRTESEGAPDDAERETAEAEDEAERAAREAAEAEERRIAEEEAERRAREAAEAEAEERRIAEEEARRALEEERAAQEEADRAAREAAEAEAEAEARRALEEEERAAREEADRAAREAAEAERQREAQEAEAARASEQAEEPAPELEEGEAAEERGLRERRQRDRAADEDPAPAAESERVEQPTEPPATAEEPTERPAEETAEEPAERQPGLRDRLRRSLLGDDDPEAAEADSAPAAEQPAAEGERALRERLRERRRASREGREPRRERAREAQRDLDDIAEEREELRDEVRQLQRQRESEVEALEREVRRRGDGEVVQRSHDRVIIRSENNYYIQNNDMRRFVLGAEDVETRRRDRGYTETVVRRRDGTRVVTVLDEFGDIVLRTRIMPDGREIVLIDNRRRGERPRRRVDYYSQVLPPLVINIPQEQYIVESRRASRRDIERALLAPPVERVQEAYSLNDVLYNERIRDMVPRVDLDTITFEFDSAEVPDDQIDTLEDIGMALEDIVANNPDEVFLIEGHTDWPGSHAYNLALSDRRAENVAIILTEFFDIPPENLVTKGYGKQYLKIETEAPERLNRRVAVRRITHLMARAE